MLTRLSRHLKQLCHPINADLPQPASPWFALFAIAGVVFILIDDLLFRRTDLPFLFDAFTDEPAHVISALLCVGALYAFRQWRWNSKILLATLLGGTAIDLDHIPAALGWNVITIGTDRPYSHSLLTLGVLLVIVAWLSKTYRKVGAATVWGLFSHFIRDLVDGGTLPLFWPLTKRGVSTPYTVYAALLLVCLIIIAFNQLRSHMQLVRDRTYAVEQHGAEGVE